MIVIFEREEVKKLIQLIWESMDPMDFDDIPFGSGEAMQKACRLAKAVLNARIRRDAEDLRISETIDYLLAEEDLEPLVTTIVQGAETFYQFSVPSNIVQKLLEMGEWDSETFFEEADKVVKYRCVKAVEADGTLVLETASKK